MRPLSKNIISTLDIVPHLVLPKDHFGCDLSCDAVFTGSLDAVEEHERTCVQLFPSQMTCGVTQVTPKRWPYPQRLISRCCTSRSTSCSYAVAAASCAGVKKLPFLHSLPQSIWLTSLYGSPWRPSTNRMGLREIYHGRKLCQRHPLYQLFQQYWLSQPSPNTFSPFDSPISDGL